MKKRILLVAVAAISASGCGTFDDAKRSDIKVHKNTELAADIFKKVEATPVLPTRDVVRFIDDGNQWASMRLVKRKADARPKLDCNIVFGPVVPVDISEFGQIITRECGVPVRITSDAFEQVFGINNTTSGQVVGQQQAGAASYPVVVPALPGVTVAKNGISNGGPPLGVTTISTRYTGKAEGLLDLVVSKLGLSWSYDGETIRIYAIDTKTFRLHAMAGTASLSSTVQSGTTATTGASGGASGGISGSIGSSQTTTMAVQTDVWADIKRSIETMLSGNGKITVSPGTGTISVSDTPEVLARVGIFVADQNVLLKKQVLVRVDILTVSLRNENNAGLSWDAVIKALQDRATVSVSNPFSIGSSAMTVKFGGSGTSKWSGSSAMVQALAEQGQITSDRSTVVSTLNLQAGVSQISRQNGYLASSSTTQTAQVGTQNSLTAGAVTTGTNVHVYPYIIDDSELLLQFSMNLSDLLGIRTLSSGDSSIEFPDLDSNNFTQKVRLKSGETYVLSGFKQEGTGLTRTGTGTAENFFLGGGIKNKTTRDYVIIMVTPVITN